MADDEVQIPRTLFISQMEESVPQNHVQILDLVIVKRMVRIL